MQITQAAADPPGRIIEDGVVPPRAPRAPRSARMRAGRMFRLIDLEGQLAVDFLCFGAAPAMGQVERYQMQTTAKILKSVPIAPDRYVAQFPARPMMTPASNALGENDAPRAADRVRHGRGISRKPSPAPRRSAW